MKWNYNEDKTAVVLDKPPRSKLKITGTRFASICGFNDWSTPFQSWCEITKTAKLPFEGNIYTEAGRTIEPKIIQYLKDTISKRVTSPEEYFGNLYESVKYDFYKDASKVFGGMWDAVITKPNGDVKTIIEIKTTKRVEDWLTAPPVYYMMQACLYAYLEGVDNVMMVVAFLEDDDYAHPEKFVPTTENTKVYMFNLSMVEISGKPFKDFIKYAEDWWNYYVLQGLSPEFDEKRDTDILKELRKTEPVEAEGLSDKIKAVMRLTEQVDTIKRDCGLDGLESKIKALKADIKEELLSQMGENDTNIKYENAEITKGNDKVEADIEALKADGLDKYLITKPGSYTLRFKKE